MWETIKKGIKLNEKLIIRVEQFPPPRRPLIFDNALLEGHYPAYTMVAYTINKYEIKY